MLIQLEGEEKYEHKEYKREVGRVLWAVKLWNWFPSSELESWSYKASKGGFKNLSMETGGSESPPGIAVIATKAGIIPKNAYNWKWP